MKLIEYPGFPFLYGQETLLFPGSDEAYYPSNEVARDDRYIYYETLRSPTDSFTFSDVVNTLKEKLDQENFTSSFSNTTLANNTIGSIIQSYGNPQMEDPNESPEQAKQLKNGLRQAYTVIKKITDEREKMLSDNERNEKEKEEMVDTLRYLSHSMHGDRLLLALHNHGIRTVFYQNGKQVSRENMHKDFLLVFQMLRRLIDSGNLKQPSEDEQKRAIEAAKRIDNINIFFEKENEDGSRGHLFSLNGLIGNFSENEKNYIKYSFFSSRDKVNIDDIQLLQKAYKEGKRDFRREELEDLAATFDVFARRQGPATKDPTGKTQRWSELVLGLEKQIKGYDHKGHIPFQINILLPYLARNGYSLYTKEYDKVYTPRDLFLLGDLPRGLIIHSVETGEEYTLPEILKKAKGIRELHKDSQAFSENSDEMYAYWNHEFQASKVYLQTLEENRKKIVDAMNKAERDQLQLVQYNTMQKRMEYELRQTQEMLSKNREAATKNKVLGKRTLTIQADSLAISLASLFNIPEFSKYAATGIMYQDGRFEIQQIREPTEDPNLLALRLSDVVDNEPAVYKPMVSVLDALAPPLLLGASSQIAKIQSEIADLVSREEFQSQLAFKNKLNEQAKSQINGQYAAMIAGTHG